MFNILPLLFFYGHYRSAFWRSVITVSIDDVILTGGGDWLRSTVLRSCVSVGVTGLFCLFVCLFVQSYQSHSIIFHSYGDVTIITGAGLLLTSARYSWSLNSEGSLTCHDYCGASVYNGHLPKLVTLTLIAERLAVELSLDLGLSRPGFEPRFPTCETSTPPWQDQGLSQLPSLDPDFAVLKFNKSLHPQLDFPSEPLLQNETPLKGKLDTSQSRESLSRGWGDLLLHQLQCQRSATAGLSLLCRLQFTSILSQVT